MAEHVLHVMADFYAFPVWDRTPGGSVGDIDPKEFGISPDLTEALIQWNEAYEVAYANGEGFQRPDGRQWIREGRRLADRLHEELPSVKVTFQRYGRI